MRQYATVRDENTPRRAATRGEGVARAEDAESVPQMVYLNTLLTQAEAAGETKTSLKTVARAIGAGRLHMVPFGARGIRIRRRDLLAWEAAGMPTQRHKESR
jgi:excisionase family DNA binding protein